MKWLNLHQEGDIPLARSSHSISCIDNATQLLLWGGENEPRKPVTTDPSLYNIASGSWSTITAPGGPSLRVAHAAAAVNNKVYFHGGRTEIGEESTLGDFYSFDSATATWTEIFSQKDCSTSSPTNKMPMARNYHSACSVGTNIYIFGGCGGTLPEGGTRRLADLWRYDTVAGTWEELPSPEGCLGRGGPGFVALDGSLWVIGGFTGKESSDIHRFDLTTNTWENNISISPSSNDPNQAAFTARSVFGRGGHSSDCSVSGCGHAGHLLVFGGEIDPSDLGHAGAGQFSNTTYCLDPKTRTWHFVTTSSDNNEEYPGPRGWGASTELPGRGVVLSGGMDDRNQRLNDLYLLDYHI
jgi:N-acetylneuraminic acid mutarotase